ncbi:MAG TPA: M13 family metallopeptidase N-terminal domain-containing protein, partial [Candidatus Sulfopaludibacter sp.]|nr:M13 family metallopeptidase N-terminal domain-containing protein [Candidatus Sulfopaludibacter sp.]
MNRNIWYALLLAVPCLAQDKPLTTLPYTPSLELKFLNRSVNPCTDFYQFACGNWNSLNPIPPDQPRWNVYAKLTDENQRFLWAILEEAAKPLTNRTPNEQKIGDYFASCMDEAAVEKAGKAPLQARLDEIAGLKRLADLPPLLAKLHMELGNDNPIFQFGSSQDFANSDQEIAFALSGGLGLPDR